VEGLKKSVEARQRCFGKDVHANLPFYYSTNKVSKQKDAEPSKCYGKINGRHASSHCVSANNKGRRRRDGSSEQSSNSDSGGSSDDEYKREDVVNYPKREFGKRSSVSPNSSKENESNGDEPFKGGSHSGMNDGSGRHHRHRRISSSGERSKGRKKGYMKPDKYEGTTCFETFLMQFVNCAEYNKWSESEKLAYLRWSLKGLAAQMLWGARDLTYKQLVFRLRSRFGSEHMEEHYRADLQCRWRKSTESLRELAQDIRRLMMLSYPGDQSPISENLAKEHFIVALEDPELELKIREREPRTLDSALRVAQRFEVFRSAIRQCKQRMSRQVTEDTWVDSSSDVVAEVDQSASKTNVQQHRQTGSKPYGCGTSTKAIHKKQRKQRYEDARATHEVRPDDWKEQMLNKMKSLEQAQQAAEANTKKIAAENVALNKEVEKLRHIEHLCAVPAPPSQQPSNSNQPHQYDRPPTCYKCGTQGHMARECPQLRTQSNAGVVCVNHGSCWDQSGKYIPCHHDYYLRATLACRTVDCLLDTGSEVCLVPDSLVHSNCIKSTGRTLKAANGTSIPILGEMRLPLSIGNFSTTIVALVSPRVIEPMLGIDFLVKNQVVWDFAKSTVTIHGISHVLRSRENKLHYIGVDMWLCRGTLLCQQDQRLFFRLKCSLVKYRMFWWL